ncbi:MAG: GWxTD domain-containing protein [Gemmatimonadota bacterium]
MTIRHRCLTAALLLALGGSPLAANAQDLDLNAIFSNDDFYKAHDLLQARGDVGFLADVWYLPASADSTRALLGVSLSNSTLQFVRTTTGRWQANYSVIARVTPERGGRAVEQTWDKAVDVGSFDETLLTGETIVFQTELVLPVGAADLSLTVRDRNADDASRVTAKLDVPTLPPARVAVAEPVLLRVYRPGGAAGGDYVVNPSHYYAAPPTQFEFLAEVSGAAGAPAPLTLAARLTPATGAGPEDSVTAWSQAVAAEGNGTVRAFGAVPNARARFGEYELELILTSATGETIARSSTPLLIAGSSGWIVRNWDDALSLIRYEATEDEHDILEKIHGTEERVAAWNCFWAMRDPVTTTSANEALQDYFRRIQIANANWKSALRPGYLSDRGRVFITLGPPDDISQRAMPDGPMPYEVWTYNRYNFQILFVDRIGFNNYQLDSSGVYQRELGAIERRKRQFLAERADQCPLLAPAFD